MVEHVGYNTLGYARSVELAVNENLAQSRVKTSQLRAPCSFAPAESRLRKSTVKVFPVNTREERLQVMMSPGRMVLRAACALLPQAQ